MARITVTIEGSSKDNGHVRLTDFIKQLEAVRSSLKQTERVVTDSDSPNLYYRIVELTYSSPARVVIENQRLGNLHWTKTYEKETRQTIRGIRKLRETSEAIDLRS